MTLANTEIARRTSKSSQCLKPLAATPDDLGSTSRLHMVGEN